MSGDESKSWQRAWTTQEMIENASNWSLAGDARLLKYLEQFSEKVLTKTKQTNDRLNDLCESAEKTTLALNIATNKFMGLKNTQFIESRVYEEDETLPIKLEQESKPEIKSKTEQERLDDIKESLVQGMDIIDRYYEKIELPDSDSDDDLNGPELYRSIDPYIDRLLPYVIGSSEWHKYWHVGLEHSSSDSEVENDPEIYSETESESDVKIEHTQTPVYDTELDDIPKKPFANSTFNENVNRSIFESSSESETGSLPPQVNTVNSNFAEELAAKLGRVESEVNTRPIKNPRTGAMFFDEPPPLQSDDILTSKNISSGLFSGGSGLFDDGNDDTDFWNTKSKIVTERKQPQIVDESNQKNTKSMKNPVGLFDDDDAEKEDEDDLFSKAVTSQPKKTILAPYKTPAPIFSDEPPELESNTTTTTVKKPIGGISIFGTNALLNEHVGKLLKNRAPSSSSSEEEIKIQKEEKKNLVEVPSVKQKKEVNSVILSKERYDFKEKPIPNEPSKLKVEPKEKKLSPMEPSKELISSIFDDTSPLFNDDLFSSNLFDSKSKTNINSGGLFDDEDLDDLFVPKHKSSLFNSNPPDLEQTPTVTEGSVQNSSSFGNETLNQESVNVLERNMLLPDAELSLSANESSGIVQDRSRLDNDDSSFLPALTSSRRLSDLFHDQNDSLLTTQKSIVYSNNKSDLSQISEHEAETITKIDITPSGHESLLYSSDSSIKNQTSVSLDTDSGQVSTSETSPGKLKHQLNINVAALLPSASPPRRSKLEKSVSFDTKLNQNVNNSTEKSESVLEKSLSFDQPIENNEILSNVSKERVRIPIKRRPSTRRARLEAIRKSTIIDSLTEIESENILNIANNNVNNSKENVDNLFNGQQENNLESKDTNLYFNLLDDKSKMEEANYKEEKGKSVVEEQRSRDVSNEDVFSLENNFKKSFSNSESHNDSDLFENILNLSPEETSGSNQNQSKFKSNTEFHNDSNLFEDIEQLSSNKTSVLNENQKKPTSDLFESHTKNMGLLNDKLKSVIQPDTDLFKSNLSKPYTNLFGVPSECPDIFPSKSEKIIKGMDPSSVQPIQNSKKTKFLFDSDSEQSDSDLFGYSQAQSKLKSDNSLSGLNSESSKSKSLFNSDQAEENLFSSNMKKIISDNKPKQSVSKTDTNLLQPKTTNEKQTQNQSSTKSIFDSDSDHEDFFATTKQAMKLFDNTDDDKMKLPKATTLKKSLFNDGNDGDGDGDGNDDLFAVLTSQTPKTTHIVHSRNTSTKKPQTRTTLKKPIENIDDPLDAFKQ